MNWYKKCTANDLFSFEQIDFLIKREIYEAIHVNTKTAYDDTNYDDDDYIKIAQRTISLPSRQQNAIVSRFKTDIIEDIAKQYKITPQTAANIISRKKKCNTNRNKRN